MQGDLIFISNKGWIQGYKGHITIMFLDRQEKSLVFPIDTVFTTANKSDFTKTENYNK